MKQIIFYSIVLLAVQSVFAQSNFKTSLFLQQSGAYYSSDYVTADGYGFGLGAVFEVKKRFILQPDINLIWGNGNAIHTRLAAGIQRPAKWSPAVYVTGSSFSGQRTEILTEEGYRPDAIVWSVGCRLAPLRFCNSFGNVSLLEVSYGRGPDKAFNIEVILFKLGIQLNKQ